MQINGGGFYGGMSEKSFDGIDVGAVCQQVCCKGMS